MMNVNIGGAKGWLKTPKAIQRNWRVLDKSPSADVVYDLNSHHSIPLCDHVVSNYYSSHTLEHIKQQNIAFVFSELKRTLARGGLIRIVVPDFERACRWYLEDGRLLWASKGPASHKDTPPTRLGRLLTWVQSPDRQYADGHHTAYDSDTLAHYLQAADFKCVQQRRYNECADVFKGLDFARYGEFSLYFEAQA